MVNAFSISVGGYSNNRWTISTTCNTAQGIIIHYDIYATLDTQCQILALNESVQMRDQTSGSGARLEWYAIVNGIPVLSAVWGNFNYENSVGYGIAYMKSNALFGFRRNPSSGSSTSVYAYVNENIGGALPVSVSFTQNAKTASTTVTNPGTAAQTFTANNFTVQLQDNATVSSIAVPDPILTLTTSNTGEPVITGGLTPQQEV